MRTRVERSREKILKMENNIKSGEFIDYNLINPVKS